MKTSWIVATGLFMLWPIVTVRAAETAGQPKRIDFQRDIQPLFRRHCYRCHGQTKAEGGVRFSSRESALGSGDLGETVIARGKPAESLLLKRLTGDEYGDLMPMDSEPLSAKQIALLQRWIAAGAEWPDAAAEDRHWAYLKPTRPALPKVNNQAWPRNGIDRFILARLEEEGAPPAKPAGRARLLRRVSLALTGLPPSWEQVEAFLADDSPSAYERVVDRLLESERYGERWAQQWLDLARYADSNGYQADQLRDSWAYRDWVIRSLNRGMPFDRFVVEQLAGDLLPEAGAEQRIATGFHRTTTCNVEAGVHPEENRVNQVFDRVNTTGTVFLGTTIECCQCHDHKYDPFTQEDYYRLFAYFNNTPLEVKQVGGVQFDFVGPTMDLPMTPSQEARRKQLQAELDVVEQRQATIRDQQLAGFDRWRREVSAALADNPARWQVRSIERFESTGGEDWSRLEDGSVLIAGSVPSTSIYRVRLDGPLEDVLGFKIETLTHASLPGQGPGRGDAKRANFVLSEFAVAIAHPDGTVTPVPLGSPEADFSQTNWEVAKAIDGDRKTGWGVSPEFHKPHWASFRTDQPLQLDAGQTLMLSLDQNLGRGRTIGRLRLSLLIGDQLTAELPDDVRAILHKKDSPDSGDDARRLKEYFTASNPQLQQLSRRAQRLRKQLAQLQPPQTLVMVEMDAPRDTHILNRGNYLDPGQQVQPGTPKALHPLDRTWPANRLGLAQWLVSKDNPLLARVTVNRWWAELFGRGLVSTVEDFGTQAEPPTHPELLDWLAVEFMESGWSMKHVHKLIVMSATFQQDSRGSGRRAEEDPENQLYARGPRFRLPAETVRDNALAISGLLSTRMYGPPIMPYQPEGIWRAVGRNQPKWQAATDEDRFRRGVYVVWKRGAPYPSFVNFDAPDRAACTVQRPRTNTPLQALTLLNDPAYAEMAVALAARIMTESPGDSVAVRAEYGFRLCLSRRPSEREIQPLVKLYEREREKLHKRPLMVQQRLQNLLPRLRPAEVSPVELAAWFAVANVLLNLDETVSL